VKRQINNIRRRFIKIFLLGRKIIQKIPLLLGSTAASRSASTGFEPSAVVTLADAVVVITGSYRGIGLALAETFLEEGAAVVINGRNQKALHQTLNQLQNRFPKVFGVASDISTSSGARLLIEESIAKFGKIDVLINNAATSGPTDKKIWDIPEEKWSSVLKTNVTGPFLCSKKLIQWARTTQHPVRIINVSSGIVDNGAPLLSAYTVSKMALEGLTLSIEEDCKGEKPLVTAVSIKPRSVMTNMTKGYYAATEYGLLDDPNVLAPIFRFAATAPPAEIMGKTFSEPAFQIDPVGEIVLNNNLSGIQAVTIGPETFKPENLSPGVNRAGAYMHLLQNPFRICPAVAEAVTQAIFDPEIHGYPDPKYTDLRKFLSEYLGISSDGLVFGPGASELIERALRTFSNRKAQIILTRPTWGLIIWPTLTRCGVSPVEVPYKGRLKTKDIRHDLDGMYRQITSATRLIYLVNPCNPTGSIVNKDDLKDFLMSIPRHIAVLLDEAYVDYCEPEKQFNLAKHLERIPCHVIGLRTFSKFFALSGFRVGYAYTRPETAELLSRLGLPFTISNIAQRAALAALKDVEFQRRVYENNDRERRRMSEAFDQMGIANMPTHTSFLLFDCPLERDRMRNDLKKEGIFMPNVDGVFEITENHAITSIGLPEHNQKILDYLSRF